MLALFWNAYAGGREPREIEVRHRLRAASKQLSEKAQQFHSDQFAPIANEVLSHFPGVEGGYFSVRDEEFVASAFPSEVRPPQHHPRSPEPPPKELPYILLQCRQAAALPSTESVSNVLDVGPSRVAIVTRAVGNSPPADYVVWTMYRLTGPEDLHAQLIRYRTSLELALGGMLLSILLMLNLGRLLKRQQQDEEKLREELRRSEQLATLGKLLAGVAHEVRNPLAGIRSTVELWQRLPETTQTPSSRAAVLHAVDRLNELVSRLLVFARPPLEPQPVQVNAIIRDVCELFAAQARQQAVEVRTELDSTLPQVPGSEGTLRQVIVNLMTNALTAMPAGGTLTWTTSHSERNHSVTITITDTGPGIPADVRQHLFEPFFTTRAEGTGLGLSLCREIVEQHGGEILLTSPVDLPGTTFRIDLPLTSR